MSDLLTLTDYNGAEFTERIAGLYSQCQHLSNRAAALAIGTQSRIEAMRRNTFNFLAEIGEALLRVQESLNGDFGDWFAARRQQLGFSVSTADRCKAAAKLVRDHGIESAFNLATQQAGERPEPILALSFRLTKPLDAMTPEERNHWRERLRPAIELDEKLAALETA